MAETYTTVSFSRSEPVAGGHRRASAGAHVAQGGDSFKYQAPSGGSRSLGGVSGARKKPARESPAGGRRAAAAAPPVRPSRFFAGWSGGAGAAPERRVAATTTHGGAEPRQRMTTPRKRITSAGFLGKRGGRRERDDDSPGRRDERGVRVEPARSRAATHTDRPAAAKGASAGT